MIDKGFSDLLKGLSVLTFAYAIFFAFSNKGFQVVAAYCIYSVLLLIMSDLNQVKEKLEMIEE